MLFTLYIIRYIVVCLALGVLFAHADKLLSYIQIEIRFIMGVCAVPYVLSMTNYILGIVWPRIPVIMLQLFLPTVSILYLVYKRRYEIISDIICIFLGWIKTSLYEIYRGPWKWGIPVVIGVSTAFVYFVFRDLLPATVAGYSIKKVICAGLSSVCVFCAVVFFLKARKDHKIVLKTAWAALWKYALLTFVAAMFVYIMGAAYGYARSPIYGNDESHYVLQAKYFNETRCSLEIDNYTGDQFGTVLKDDHGPLWPVYLADAMAFSTEKYVNSPALEFAFITTAFLMLLLLSAAGTQFSGKSLGGGLAVAFFLFYRYSLHFVMNGSRDGFRIIGLLLLLMLLYEFTMRMLCNDDSKTQMFDYKDACAIALFSFLCINGHGSSAVIMAGMFLCFGFTAFFLRCRISELFALGCAACLGTFLGMIKNILLFLQIGSFRSYTSQVFEGTAVIEQLRANNARQESASAVISSFTKAEWQIITIGLICLLICIFLTMKCLTRKIQDRQFSTSEASICAMTILCTGMLLPMTGVFDFLNGYSFMLWFAMQLRYRMYFLMVAALIAGVCIANVTKNEKRFILNKVIQICILFICLLTLTVMKTCYKSPASYIYDKKVVDTLISNAQQIEQFVDSRNIYINEQVLNIYFEKPPKLLFEYNSRPLITAKTKAEIESALHELQAQVFVFTPSQSHDYSLLPFYDYLLTAPHVDYFEIDSVSTDAPMRVFLLHESFFCKRQN